MHQTRAGGTRPRLVLWRHGQTEWNVLEKAQGHADIPLDATGRRQAQEAAKLLVAFKPRFIWSSDLERARHTAAELARLTGLEPVLDKRLREYHVGIREGTTFGEFRQQHPDVHRRFFAEENYRVPGAELPSEVNQRMKTVMMEAAVALQGGGTGVLVGHGAALRSGLLAFFDAPAHMREMFAGMANCAWTVLEEHPDRGWQIIDFNAQTLPSTSVPLADDMPAAHNP